MAAVPALHPVPSRRASHRPLRRAAVITIALTCALIVLRRRWPAGLTAWIAYIALLLPRRESCPTAPDRGDRTLLSPLVGWDDRGGLGPSLGWRAWAADALTPALARGALAPPPCCSSGSPASRTDRSPCGMTPWRSGVTRPGRTRTATSRPSIYLGWELAEGAVSTRLEPLRGVARAGAGQPARAARTSSSCIGHRGAAGGTVPGGEAPPSRGAHAGPRSSGVLDPSRHLLHARGARGEAAARAGRRDDRSPAWPRYQFWELRLAVAEVPDELRKRTRNLVFHLAVLLQQYRAHLEAEELYGPRCASIPSSGGLEPPGRRPGRARPLCRGHGGLRRALRLWPRATDACANARRAAAALGVRPVELDGCPPERT